MLRERRIACVSRGREICDRDTTQQNNKCDKRILYSHAQTRNTLFFEEYKNYIRCVVSTRKTSLWLVRDAHVGCGRIEHMWWSVRRWLVTARCYAEGLGIFAMVCSSDRPSTVVCAERPDKEVIFTIFFFIRCVRFVARTTEKMYIWSSIETSASTASTYLSFKKLFM